METQNREEAAQVDEILEWLDLQRGIITIPQPDPALRGLRFLTETEELLAGR